MKVIILILIITINIYAEKVTTVKINNYKKNVIKDWIYIDGKQKLYFLEQNKKRYYLRGNYPKGKKTIGLETLGHMENNKMIIKKRKVKYYIYNLYCIKENNIHFACTEYKLK